MKAPITIPPGEIPLAPRRSPLPEPRVRDRMLVVYNRVDSLGGFTKVQGMFSEFFAVLGALRYAERHGAAGVRVWFDSALYRDDRVGPNWWSYFFADTMRFDPSRAAAPEVHCRGWHRFGPHAWNESWTSQIIPGNSNLRPYPLDSAAEAREAARLTKCHIRVKPEVLAEVEAFRSAHAGNGEFVIGLHFRGTDKVLAYPYKSPSFDAYRREVDRILAAHRPASHRIFVATDQREFAEWARNEFQGRMFTQEDAPLLAQSDPGARELGLHKNLAIPAHVKARAAVRKCLLLARCDYLVKNRSSLSDISLAFNPRLPWTFILGDGEVARGTPIAEA